MKISIEDYFKYHPPVTRDRIVKHEAINQAALEFAKVINSSVLEEDCKKMALFSIQQARMFANQGATIDELISEADW